MPDHNEPLRARIETWGEIANYLGAAVRTVQLWERDDGLPVHRRGHRVFAYCDELHAWLKARETSPRNGTTESSIRAPETPVSPNIELKRSALLRLSGVVLTRRTAPFLAAAILATLAGVLLSERRPGLNDDASAAKLRVGTVPRLLAKLSSENANAATIALPEAFQQMIVSPDERRIFLAYQGSRRIGMLDLRTNKVRTFEAPFEFGSMAVSPDGKQLFVGSFSDGLIQLDAVTGQILEQVPTGGAVSDIAVAPDGQRLYLAMMARGVRRYSLSGREWKQITNLGCPHHCAVDPQGNKLLVSYQCGGPTGRNGHDAIEIFDLRSEKSLRTFSGPPMTGEGHVFFSDGDRIWLNGGDACYRDIYDRAGCPLVPGQVHHIFRHSDGQILHSVGLPWANGAGPAPILFHNGERVLVAQPRGIAVLETARFAALESYRFPIQYFVSSAAILSDANKMILMVPSRKELWVVPMADPACDNRGPGAVHHFSGDGTEEDSIDNASIEPPTSYQPGIVGQAFELDGGQRSVIHSKSRFRFGSSDSTLALYAKTFSDEPAILLDAGDASEYWRISGGTAGIEFTSRPSIGTALTVRTHSGLSRDKWTHVALTHTDSGITLFVNGVRAQHAQSPLGALRLTRHFAQYSFGWSRNIGEPYRGLIDEVTFWSRALSSDEILSLYQRRNEAKCR